MTSQRHVVVAVDGGIVTAVVVGDADQTRSEFDTMADEFKLSLVEPRLPNVVAEAAHPEQNLYLYLVRAG
jgi:hypothetical protein